MDEFYAFVAYYLLPPTDRSWRWSHSAEAVEWADGTTIAFAAEIAHVIQRLAHIGLPPFDALLLVLAACRDSWPTQKNSLDRVLKLAAESPRLPEAGRVILTDQLAAVRAGLESIHAIPRELRVGSDQVVTIAAQVFDGIPDDCKSLTPSGSAAMIQVFERGLDGHALNQAAEDRYRWSRAVYALYETLTRFDASTLELKRKTGLDRLVTPAEMDVPPFERVRGLLRTLDCDNEFGAITKLARRLMAAVHIPRPLSDPEELPMGGISDISHRGPLDRLLLSELANDDLTLAARLALNEALYLRRETPPSTPRGRRAILLDTGIRLWGVPRVFATAVGLALAATATTATELLVFRAQGADVVPVDLTTREGLIEHLAALETAPHPAGAIEPFLCQVAPGLTPLDAFVVTHRKCLEDRDFRRTLPHGCDPLYCALVDADGSFRLVAFTHRGHRDLIEASFALDEVLEPSRPDRPRVELIDPRAPRGLPAILSVDPFPLLIPCTIRPKRSVYCPQCGIVTITPDGRLMHNDPSRVGARQLAANVPKGHLRWASVDDDGTAHLVVGDDPHLITANLPSGCCSIHLLTPRPARRASFVEHNRVLLSIDNEGYDVNTKLFGQFLVFDLTTGAHRFTAGAKGCVSSLGGRFYSSTAGWFAMVWDGSQIRFEAVNTGPWSTTDSLLYIFDRRGRDGPWILTRSGMIVSTATQERVTLGKRFTANRVIGVSRDGNRLVVFGTLEATPSFRGCLRICVDLESGLVAEGDYASITARFLEPELAWPNIEEHLAESVYEAYWGTTGLRKQAMAYRNKLIPRKRFRGVIVETGTGLSLVTFRFRQVLLKPPFSGIGTMRFVDAGRARAGPGDGFFAFAPTESPPGVRYSLQVADLPGGNKVYLDSRGLLHLQPSDPDIPETTLVVFDGWPVAGWSSDGACCGGSHFLLNPGPSDERIVFANVRRFLERVWP